MTKERYSLYRILKEGLLNNKHGEPYVTEASIRKRLRDAGFKPNVKTMYGMAYGLTKKDIQRLNKCG